MHDQTITLFNCHEQDGVRWWYPTVFSGVTLHEVRAGSASAHAGIVNADTVDLILSVSADTSSMDSTGRIRRYVEPKVYAALEDPAGYFTFWKERDFFAVGDYTAEGNNPVLDSDYSGGFYQTMNKERDGVYTVTSSCFYPLIPHFEIGGR